jgi:hypothetical protein
MKEEEDGALGRTKIRGRLLVTLTQLLVRLESCEEEED